VHYRLTRAHQRELREGAVAQARPRRSGPSPVTWIGPSWSPRPAKRLHPRTSSRGWARGQGVIETNLPSGQFDPALVVGVEHLECSRAAAAIASMYGDCTLSAGLPRERARCAERRGFNCRVLLAAVLMV